MVKRNLSKVITLYIVRSVSEVIDVYPEEDTILIFVRGV
jgi:hypothetical protein